MARPARLGACLAGRLVGVLADSARYAGLL